MNDSTVQSELEHEIKAPILEATGASRIYHVGNEMTTTVSDVSLQVGYGDFAVVFGPSGAGKSTLMNMLMGLEKPDVGEVFLKGESLYGFNEEQRTTLRGKRIGYLPQNQYWIEFMNLIDNVALPLILQGWSQHKARAEAREWIKKVGLEEHIHQKPDELSSGQQQKAAVARCLIKKPWLIFADEPTAHLDSKSVEEVTELLLSNAKENGITIIMVTHDLSFLKLSKKWFFMRDGRLWDIKDKRNPFNNIRDALNYVDSGKNESADVDANMPEVTS